MGVSLALPHRISPYVTTGEDLRYEVFGGPFQSRWALLGTQEGGSSPPSHAGICTPAQKRP